MNNYFCLKKQIFTIRRYSIVPLREQDIFQIMDWRNLQIQVLRQKEILTRDVQQEYYQQIVKPTFKQQQPKQILFSFLCAGDCIGYGGLVHIDWEAGCGEMSFLVSPERAASAKLYEEDFSNYIHLIKMVTFEELDFNCISGETYDIRDHHVAIMERNGFKLEGRLRDHVLIDGRYVDSLIHDCVMRN